MSPIEFPPWTRDDDDQQDTAIRRTKSTKSSTMRKRRLRESSKSWEMTFSKRNVHHDWSEPDSPRGDGWDSDDSSLDHQERPSSPKPDWAPEPQPLLPSLAEPPFIDLPPQEVPTPHYVLSPVIQPSITNVNSEPALATGPPLLTGTLSILPVSPTTLQTSYSLPRKETTPAPAPAPAPAPTLTRPVLVLPPPTTSSLPPVITGARKGVESPKLDHYDDPDTPIMTASPTGTPVTSALPLVTQDFDKSLNSTVPELRGGLLPKTERALIAVGSIGATVIVFFVCWLVWKCVKLHKNNDEPTIFRRKVLSAPWLHGPKRAIAGLASRIPGLTSRLNKRSWTNLDKSTPDSFWEKQLPSPPSHQSQLNRQEPQGIIVHTAVARHSHYGQGAAQANIDASPPTPTAYQLTMSAAQPQHGINHGSNRITRLSEMSSLSSGFGDGDIVVPAVTKASAMTVTSVTAPAPVAQRSSISSFFHRRETVYTEASEDPLPRFRSINSWVRQQSGRVTRAKQREQTASDTPPVPSMPPEQDFRLMMPDGEEPRRVEGTPKGLP